MSILMFVRYLILGIVFGLGVGYIALFIQSIR